MIGQQPPPKSPACADGWVRRWQVAGLCLGLAAITFAVFGRTAGFGFVNYDDDEYVYGNPMVAGGLSLKGLAWALTYGKIGHWHPLTWVSHMADCQMYGLNPGGHHLTNVALHAMAAVFLFLALREMTGGLWRSAFVAAVFAIHPLRVESVAWIAERKDVLSGVFFMLTLWAYARYARQPSRGRVVAVAVWFGLGLLCKNTLVTLPFLLLLLDWWPLQRVRPGVVKEKIPLFLLSVGSCVATFLVPEKVAESVRLPLVERIGNAVVSYGIYLRQMVYPAGLAIPYLNPPHGQPFWKIALVFVLLAAISIGVLAWRNKCPCLLVGWLWYLGMLVPTIGIVQISYYFHADRYTYLPGIGLALAGTWAVAEWSATWKHRQVALGGLMAAVISALMFCAWQQTAYWQNSETLWHHTLAWASDNYKARSGLALALFNSGNLDQSISQYRQALHIMPNDSITQNNLAAALLEKGEVDEAIDHCRQALQIRPDFAEAHYDLGRAIFKKGGVDEAIAQFHEALQIKPGFAAAHFTLATALRQKGQLDEAISQYEEALQIKPDFGMAHNDLGTALRQKGRLDEAIAHYQKALETLPDNESIHVNLANAFLQMGRVDQAIAHYQNALQIEPADMEAQNNLAWLLATSAQASLRNGEKAVQLARQANEQAGGKNPVILGTLAAALAETGQFGDASRNAEKAISLAQTAKQTALARRLNSELQLYEAGRPFHQP